MTRQRPGRSTAQLLADFGHEVPMRPDPPRPVKERSLFSARVRGVGGIRKPGRGWSPASAPVSQWRMTSDQAPALWPLIATPALPPTGAQIGIDELSGGSFYADPLGWVLDDRVPVTNPNILSFGKPGGGKSTDSKVFLLAMMDFGYKAFIHGDVKDEYEGLCHAFGVEPFIVGPGMPTRINPLDMGPLGNGWGSLTAEETKRRAGIIFRRWVTLIGGLVGSQFIGDRRVPFGPTDALVVSSALAQLTGFGDGNTTLSVTTLPRLWQALNEPTDALVDECRFADRRQFLDETRLLRDALAQLCTGVLAGMFDDHTTIKIDWDAPIQSLSLSRLEPLGDEATGIALTCLSSWGRAMREVKDAGDLRINVRDEMWKQMRLGLSAVKSLDADLRLSRRDGEIQYMIGHKPGDMLSVGEADSAATAIAKELLHLADIKILHGQDPTVASELEELLELGPIARNLVTDWATQRKGRAVWCVGDQLYKVQTFVHPAIKALTYTNQAIDAAA